jgi:cytochrome b
VPGVNIVVVGPCGNARTCLSRRRKFILCWLTGLVAYGEEGKGPLAAVMVIDGKTDGNEVGHRQLAERRGAETERTIGELHGLMANITVALVAAHIFGVVVASVVHKENLVLAMITGRKRRARD